MLVDARWVVYYDEMFDEIFIFHDTDEGVIRTIISDDGELVMVDELFDYTDVASGIIPRYTTFERII